MGPFDGLLRESFVQAIQNKLDRESQSFEALKQMGYSPREAMNMVLLGAEVETTEDR